MDGAALAARMREEIKHEVADLGRVGLATVLVGEDPASEVYIRLKHKAAQEAGIEAIDHRLPGDDDGGGAGRARSSISTRTISSTGSWCRHRCPIRSTRRA